jgi:putative acetyltransferase
LLGALPHATRGLVVKRATTRALVLRNEAVADYEAVHEVHRLAFGQLQEAELVSRLRGAVDPSLSLVAVLEGRVVAHVLFSPVTLDDSPGLLWLGLAPVGVLPSFQGQGIGSQLIQNALERCTAAEFEVIVVLGDPRYYSRFGFTLAAPLGLHYESSAFDRAFQVLELAPDALVGRTGFVRYHPVFSSTSHDG